MSKLPPKQIIIDFDSTCVLHDYPDRGGDVPHAVEVLKKLVKAGHALILHTMRHDHLLDDAEAWFHERDIELTFINCNPTQETGSRKVYAHLHIDDHNLGCPLIQDHQIHHKPFVDWTRVEEILVKMGYL